ncbi:MAG: HAD family hydrolase [Planctomycetota bacterium]|nr:HAD family hydrolase [Planctomycetota bacterium]
MREYDAIILDLDGTLIEDGGGIRPRVRSALHRISEAGVHVMIATGRSEQSAAPVLDDLQIFNPMIVYNGAAVYCPNSRSLIEERNIDRGHLDQLLHYAKQHDLLPVVMCADSKRALSPRTDALKFALHDMKAVEIVAQDQMRIDRPIRLSLFSEHHHDTKKFADEIRAISDSEAYFTWFPLNLLPSHQDSSLLVVDVQPPCEGKKEALMYLQKHHGISADRCVAIGDATNDSPMVELAGLGVAMGNAMEELKQVADRVIGANDTDAIADLIDELWVQ